MNRAMQILFVMIAICGSGVTCGQEMPRLQSDPPSPVFDDPLGNKYFPDDRTSFDRYTRHLLAMGEPSLFSLADDREHEVYRFLYVPTFSKPIDFRAYVDGEDYRMTITRLSGNGGYDPGKKELTGTMLMEPIEFEALRNAMANPNLRSPISELQAEAFAVLDGEQWILESLSDGEYSLAQVQSPEFLIDPDPTLVKRRAEFAKELGIEIPDLKDYVEACRMFVAFAEVQLPERQSSESSRSGD